MPEISTPISTGISWYDAWRAAAVGPGGFWNSARPSEHFRTAAGATGLLAGMFDRLLAAHPDVCTVVDIGAGDGRLLAGLMARRPQLRLVGLDLRPAPADLDGVDWRRGCWDVEAAAWQPYGPVDPVPLPDALGVVDGPLLICCSEWLDDLPAVVAERGPDGWRHVLVDADGRESIGAPVPGPDAYWLDRWWPAADGDRGESGRTRDRAWAAMIDCLRPYGGLAVMIDYGHRRRDRPAGGTLTGYQQGRQVRPRPSAELNLTAHVAVDSLQAAGEVEGARTEMLITQREAAERLLPGRGRTDESDTLARLQASGERRLLSEALGDHWWLVQSLPARAATGSPGAG